jgi:uracil phosphoribosyltransferase
MEIKKLDSESAVLNVFVAELRNVAVQGDSMRFRRNLERAGEVMAYEISKTFDYSPRLVETPLGEAEMLLPDNEVVVASILRAGIPFHNGFLNMFDRAQSAFVSAYRKYSKDGTFNIKVEYVQSGSLEGKTLILVDPMMATGSSAVFAYKALVEKGGTPAHTHLATVVASEEALEYVKKRLPRSQTTLWCAAVDQELTVKSYIVPGIGDVGDLAYGDKM